jgi:hypothetical protein
VEKESLISARMAAILARLQYDAPDVIRGINYPWAVFDGRANYGCDFGRNKWGSHTGVSVNRHDVRIDFTMMGGAGIEVARWFVFTDGRAGIRWNGDGGIDGLDAEFFADMDAALEIAAASGVRLCLVLLDFLWFDDPQRRLALLDRDDRSAFLDRVIDPFVDRYGASGAIHSFDLINEPDWVTEGLATDPHRAAWPLARLRSFAGMMSARLRARSRALLTIGGGRVATVREWDHDSYALDFVQVHAYPDVRFPRRDENLFGKIAAGFALSRPLLIGEFPAHPRVHPPHHLSPAYTLADYLQLARDGGYLGAWPWSFKGTDAFGAVDLTALAASSTTVRAPAPAPPTGT